MTGIPETRTIALAADHGGWPLKEAVRAHLESNGFRTVDFSLPGEEPVDYPDVGLPAVLEVSLGRIPRAVLVCGTGLGMSILANKVPGIRACLCHDTYTARMSRAHNDSNVLVLGGRVTGGELAREIVTAWLETPFEGGRHQRRLDKIRDLEDHSRRGDIHG